MIGIIYFILALVLSTLSSQYIFGGDSAEFSAIASTWSIPHPPGYPLYSLLANIVTHSLPFGTIPWKTSLLSVIPTALTAYLIYKILIHLKVRGFIALISSLLYVVLFPVWEYTLVPEVFALNTLLVTAITYLLLLFNSSQKTNYLLLTSFLVGLCVAHHHIFLIFIPGWMLLIKPYVKMLLNRRFLLIKLLFTFLLGASVYVYAPIASFFNPPIQWENAKTISGFWRLITRAMYGTFTAYGGSKGNIVNQLYDVASTFIFILQDFRILGSLVIGVGVVISLKNKTKGFISFLLVTSVLHLFFLFYTNFMLVSPFSVAMYERFLISFYMILTLYFALGYDYLYSHISKFISNLTRKKSIVSLTKFTLLFVLVIYISTIAITNYSAISYIKNGQDFDRLGRDIINTIPNDALFFPSNDNANFTTLYHIFAEKTPTKARFFQINFLQQKYYIDRFKKSNKDLHYPKELKSSEDLKTFINLNSKRGVYLENPMSYGMWVPYGLLWKYYASLDDATADLKNIVSANTHLWKNVYHIPKLNKNTRNLLHLQAVQDFYVDAYISYAKLLYIANQIPQSEHVMKEIMSKYRPTSIHIKASLLNLTLLEKKCDESKAIADEFINDPVDSIQSELLVPLGEFYSLCDSNNIRLNQVKRRVENLKEKSLTPLNRF